MQSAPVENPKDLTNQTGKAAQVEIWTKEIENAEKSEEKWRNEATKFFNIYNDQYSSGGYDVGRYNIFWANTQTLRPLVFSKLPKSNITQRFLDKDEISRIASEMMERNINYCLSESDAEQVFNHCRDDYLIGGRGLARVVYDPEEALELEDGSEGLDYSTKKTRIEYVDWKDFRMSPENEWNDVRWIAFRHKKSRAELIEDFGSKGAKVDLNISKLTNLSQKDQENDLYQMAEVWEIWDKQNRKVLFLTTGQHGQILSEDEDPYNLQGFYPIPKPLGSNSDPSCLIPVPLYRMYKTQAEDLNEVEDRIRSLVKQCKATGLYSSMAEGQDVENLLNGDDGQFSPIKSTQPNLAVKDLVFFKPLGEIITTINELNQRKQILIDNIRDITGLSDIVRGITTASETATAQQLKGNFAISRIQPIQKEAEIFVRDVIRLLVELNVEKYSIQELAETTNLKIVDLEAIAQKANESLRATFQRGLKEIEEQDDPQAKEKIAQLQQQAEIGFKKTMKQPLEDLKGYAVTPQQLAQLDSLIKNDKLRMFSIDVETDSTIRIDQQQEKQDRVEYITAISNFSSSFFPLVQAGILTPDTFNQFLNFISKPFKVGRNLEEVLTSNEEPEPKQPSTEELLAQAESKRKDQELQLKSQEIQMNGEFRNRELDIKTAEVKFKIEEHNDTLDFEDVNKQADRDAKTAQDIIKIRTKMLEEQIRQANKQPAL